MEYNRNTCRTAAVFTCPVHVTSLVDCVWNVMAHAQKPDFVFRRNAQVHLNRRGRQFSRLLTAEVCASAVVMLYTPYSEVVWRVLATHSNRQFPLHFLSRASPCAITFRLTVREISCLLVISGAPILGIEPSTGCLSVLPVLLSTTFTITCLFWRKMRKSGDRMPQSYCFLDGTKKPQQSFPCV
jgi:hypothetical protein